MNKVLAMILAGGRVDELDVLTLYRPKSAVPFGGMFRIIDFPLSNLMHSEIERVGVLLQYRSSSLITHIGSGASWDMVGRNRGAFVLPPYIAAGSSEWYKGTADAIHQNFDFIDEYNPELVLVLSGDHIYKMNYTPLVEYHREKNADLTAAFVQIPMSSAHRFGLATIDAEDGDRGGRIIEYKEKPLHPISQWASLTIYLFKTEILKKTLDEFEKQKNSCEFGRDIIPYMVQNYRAYAFKFYDYWAYARTIDELWQANMDLLGEHPKLDFLKWKMRTNLNHRSIRDRIPTLISSQAIVEDSLIPHGCIIEGEVRHSILFPGVEVGKGAIIENSVVMFDTKIEEQSFLHNVIVDTDVKIGRSVYLGYEETGKPIPGNPNCTVVGQYTEIPDELQIGRNCMISPRLKKDAFKQKIYPSGVIIS